MRANLFIIGGLIAALAITVAFSHIVTPTELEEHAETLHRQIVAGEWTQADASLDRLKQEWTGRRPWLQLTKSVQTIFEIDLLLARLQANIELEDRSAAAASLAEIRRLWLDLRE